MLLQSLVGSVDCCFLDLRFSLLRALGEGVGRRSQIESRPESQALLYLRAGNPCVRLLLQRSSSVGIKSYNAYPLEWHEASLKDAIHVQS